MIKIGDLVQLDFGADIFGIVLQINEIFDEYPETNGRYDVHVYWFDSNDAYWCFSEGLQVISSIKNKKHLQS